jgi:hypothetical protein
MRPDDPTVRRAAHHLIERHGLQAAEIARARSASLQVAGSQEAAHHWHLIAAAILAMTAGKPPSFSQSFA